MELKREQIIKALECCTSEIGCKDCPRFGFVPCTKPLMTDALSLIKELTEENERLKQSCTNLVPTLNEIRADTVREMRERLRFEIDRFGKRGGFFSKEVIYWFIDHIAKEIIGEKNDT